MKGLILSLAMMAFAVPAFAQSGDTSNTTKSAQTGEGGNAQQNKDMAMTVEKLKLSSRTRGSSRSKCWTPRILSRLRRTTETGSSWSSTRLRACPTPPRPRGTKVASRSESLIAKGARPPAATEPMFNSVPRVKRPAVLFNRAGPPYPS